MIRYFPNLFDDELLYSALSRYAYRIEEGRFKPSARQLFGTENVIATWDFPSNIENLVKNIACGCSYSSEEIIFSNTMLPLYFPFLDKERQQYALESMKSTNGKGIFMKLGAMASKVKGLTSLKYCPSCITEDTQKYGVAYWHRSHNVPGITLCHKHEVPLRDRCPVCGVVVAPKSRNKFALFEDICPNGHTLTLSKIENCITHEKEVKIAKAVNYLLCNDMRGFNSSIINEIYIEHLREKNLVTPRGIIRQTELITQFKQYYGDNFLNKIGLNVEKMSNDCWISCLVRRTERVLHPLPNNSPGGHKILFP